MRKLIVALCVASIAQAAGAQAPVQTYPPPVGPPTAAEQDALESAKAKQSAKMTTAEKDKVIKEVNKQMIKPDMPKKTGDFPPYGPRNVRPFIGGGPEISGK